MALPLAVALASSLWPRELARAQSTPSITIEATVKANALSETPLVITVGPASSLPRGAFVRLFGLPPLAALSAGHSIAPGAWAVPVTDLPRLKVVLPGAVSGNSALRIAVVSSDGSVLAEATSMLVVLPKVTPPQPAAPAEGARAPPGGAPPSAAARALPPQASPTPARVLNAEERERAMRLVKRGDEQLAEGGVAQARLFYERAAEAGLAQGAMALASTYDPDELERLGAIGIQPDRAAAARWYERARALGATDAAQRLQRLGAR